MKRLIFLLFTMAIFPMHAAMAQDISELSAMPPNIVISEMPKIDGMPVTETAVAADGGETAASACSGINCPDPYEKKHMITLGASLGTVIDKDTIANELKYDFLASVDVGYRYRVAGFYAVGAEVDLSFVAYYAFNARVNVYWNNTFYLYTNRYFALTFDADLGYFYHDGQVWDSSDEPWDERTGTGQGMLIRGSVGMEFRIFWLMSVMFKFNAVDNIYFKNHNPLLYSGQKMRYNYPEISGTLGVGFHF